MRCLPVDPSLYPCPIDALYACVCLLFCRIRGWAKTALNVCVCVFVSVNLSHTSEHHSSPFAALTS